MESIKLLESLRSKTVSDLFFVPMIKDDREAVKATGIQPELRKQILAAESLTKEEKAECVENVITWGNFIHLTKNKM